MYLALFLYRNFVCNLCFKVVIANNRALRLHAMRTYYYYYELLVGVASRACRPRPLSFARGSRISYMIPKGISTRDPPLTVVPSPTDPLLVLFADGTVQALNPSLPPAIFDSSRNWARHSFAFAIEITSPLLVREVRYLPFLVFQSILCSASYWSPLSSFCQNQELHSGLCPVQIPPGVPQIQVGFL